LLNAWLPPPTPLFAGTRQGEENLMRTDNRVRGTVLVSLALVISIAGVSGCRKKTPAEKVGDKIENAGDKLEDKIDEAN
jgi:hypothetical protein